MRDNPAWIRWHVIVQQVTCVRMCCESLCVRVRASFCVSLIRRMDGRVDSILPRNALDSEGDRRREDGRWPPARPPSGGPGPDGPSRKGVLSGLVRLWPGLGRVSLLAHPTHKQAPFTPSHTPPPPSEITLRLPPVTWPGRKVRAVTSTQTLGCGSRARTETRRGRLETNKCPFQQI